MAAEAISMNKRKLFLCIVLPAILCAQVETARIIGYVKDQSGAMIPNATVTMVNTATNIRRSSPELVNFASGNRVNRGNNRNHRNRRPTAAL